MNVKDRVPTHGAHSVRQFDFTECEFRGDANSDKFEFVGIASVVDAPYSVRDQWGEFTETIRAGAFNKTLKDGKADVALYINHDTRALPLATRLDGSLDLTAAPHLEVRARLNPKRPSVQEAFHAVNDGQARQMSIGFSVPKSRDHWSDDYTQREIAEVNLGETSIVWRGANHLTSGGFRSLEDILTDFDTLDPDELRRAIGHLESLLPATGPQEHDVEHHRMLAEMWDQLRTPAA